MEVIKYARNDDLSLKEQLDKIDEVVKQGAYDGYYWSKLNILMGMWEKGKVFGEFRGGKIANSWRELT